MSVRGFALYRVSTVVMAAIGRLGDKQAAFAKWSGMLRRRARRLPGRTYYGATFDCDLHDLILSRIFFFGVWEPSVSNAIAEILRPGDVFVDVGANVGYDSLLGSKVVGDEGSVVAIEAATSIFSQLQSNLDRNQVSNVRTANVAVGKERGELTLYGGDSWNQGRTSPLLREGLRAVETVPMLALDEILTPEERNRTRLIKIDIEGGELPVLERLAETLDLYSKQLHILVELSPEPTGLAAKIFDALVPARFSAFSIENDYSVASYLDSTAPIPPERITRLPPHQVDILFAPVSA